jgi:Sulfotransferase family
MTDGPTLLYGVGAAKAGTSWLYRHLRGHPDCHLRTIKELHYFDTLESGNFERQAAAHRQRLTVAAGDTNLNAAQRARRARDTADWIAVLDRRGADGPAYLDYLTAGRGSRPLVADITPAYGMLPEARLRQMASVVRETRFLFILRDPLSRLWSHLRMLAQRRAGAGGDVEAQAHGILARVLAGQEADAVNRGDYAGTVARLRRAVDPSRLLILFQEELMSLPGLARLWAFLGISARQTVEFDARVHEGARVALPEASRRRALALLAPQYEFVAREFGPLPQAWARLENGVL